MLKCREVALTSMGARTYLVLGVRYQPLCVSWYVVVVGLAADNSLPPADVHSDCAQLLGSVHGRLQV